ncbi:hypothetical protein HDU81_000600, partial [Chytriomyces hyalinus]
MKWTQPTLAVLTTIWACGFLANGAILVSIVRRRSSLSFNEHLRTIATLLLLCQAWSLVNVVNDAVYLLVGEHDSSFYAILSNAILILIFGANFILSIERYYTVCKEEPLRLRHYLFIYSGLFLYLAAIVAVIVVSPNELDFQPAEMDYFVIWRSIVTTCFLTCLIGMVFCYTATYRYTTKLIAQTAIANQPSKQQQTPAEDCTSVISWENETTSVNSESSKQEFQYRQRIASCVLWSCIIMSSAMVVCYVPYIVWLHTADYWSGSPAVGDIVSGVAAFDVFLTPGLILYLKTDIREACWAT